MLRAGDIYFAGDTGYGPFADQIKERFPEGFRFGILPIGAYEPQWFMRHVHTSPDDAWTLKEKLGIENTMASHFGTFKLADDAQDAPRDRMAHLADERKDGDRFKVLENGQSMRIGEDDSQAGW